MTRKIIRSIILISTVSVLFASFIVMILMNRFFYKKIEIELHSEAELISNGIEFGGADYLKKNNFNDIRVLWIAKDGGILFDSEKNAVDYNDITNSKEIEEAFEKGQSSSSRKLINISQTALIYAMRLDDGTVIRVSDIHLSFLAQLAGIIKPLLMFLVIAAALSIMIADKVSRKIVQPINNIDLDHPKIEANYSELAPLLNKLRIQNGRVNRQMEELRQSREQFSLITESMSEGIIIADQKLGILASNSGALALLEAEPVKEGQSIYSLNNSEMFRRCIQDAAGGRNSECILKTENGDREIIASPAKSGNVVNGIVVLIMDVTQKQELENMRKEFTSNVSHELKTPLTTIYGISDMLAGGLVKAEDTAQFGEKIKNEADRLITLINDIMSLSKLDEVSGFEQMEEIDIYELAGEVLIRLERAALEKNIKTELVGENIIYFGNRTVLEEIIYNLCDNAVKYNFEGGRIEVKVSHMPKTVFITVSDTGMGIPSQHTDRIFERFYRVDKSRSRKINGTGLGLSIVKHGVIYHGGTVRVESVAGKGSVFTVELPVRGTLSP
ncbi:MAG: ATP-binding protein [Ruminococcus flavefaciens]|nr:ATP-binding protein [Ruminococcus flavefaciens]MCM1058905.1 ATP-binding protein [Eubacterium sp.]